MEGLFLALVVILFVPASLLWWHGVKAAGRAAKTAVTAHPQETLGLVKFVVGTLRK